MREQEVYTAREVAKKLRLNIYTVHDLLRTGKLKGFKISENGQWRIRAKDLEEFMQTGAQ